MDEGDEHFFEGDGGEGDLGGAARLQPIPHTAALVKKGAPTIFIAAHNGKTFAGGQVGAVGDEKIDHAKALDDLVGGAFEEEFALFDQTDVVGKALEVIQAMRGDEDGVFAVFDGFEEFGEDLLFGDGVEAGNRFVLTKTSG